MGLFEKKENEAEAFTLHSKEILNVSGLTFNAAAVLVDNETGVNYLIVTGEHGASVIPRLNPDGTVMVTK